jgi:hypothetical protein
MVLLSAVVGTVVSALTNLVTDAFNWVLVAGLVAAVVALSVVEYALHQRTPDNRARPGRPESVHGTQTTPEPDPPKPAVPQWQLRANIDHAADGYFGRDGATGSLVNTLVGHGNQIVSVLGQGGIGKTTTAYEAVRRAEDTGAFHSILWVKAHGEPWQPGGRDRARDREWVWEDTVNDLAAQLGVELSPSDLTLERELSEAVQASGDQGWVLTVLDNLETAAEMTEFTRRLHEMGFASPRHKLLLTSRVSGALEEVQPISLKGLGRDDAIAFIRYLGAGDEQFATAPDSTFDPILRVVEGNPLLIKMAVRRFISGHRSFREIVDDLMRSTNVANHLFNATLTEWEDRVGHDAVQHLMYAFSVEGRPGEQFTKDRLRELSGLDDSRFDEVFDAGRDLGLIEGGRFTLNERYSVHSLLYTFVQSRRSGGHGR